MNERDLKWIEVLSKYKNEIKRLRKLIESDKKYSELSKENEILKRELKKYKDLYQGLYIKTKEKKRMSRSYYYNRYYGSASSMPKHN